MEQKLQSNVFKVHKRIIYKCNNQTDDQRRKNNLIIKLSYQVKTLIKDSMTDVNESTTLKVYIMQLRNVTQANTT